MEFTPGLPFIGLCVLIATRMSSVDQIQTLLMPSIRDSDRTQLGQSLRRSRLPEEQGEHAVMGAIYIVDLLLVFTSVDSSQRTSQKIVRSSIVGIRPPLEQLSRGPYTAHITA